MTASASKSSSTTRTAKNVDRLALIRAKAEERATAKAEREELKAKLSAKAEAEDANALAQCHVILDRMSIRGAKARAKRRATAEHLSPRKRARLARTAPITGRTLSTSPVERSVPDPYAPGSFERVTFNGWIDILERERKNLDAADFEVGRMCQAIWERGVGARISSSLGNLGRAGEPDRELTVALSVDDAIKVREFNASVIAAVGSYGMQVLRRYLVEGKTFRGHLGMLASERMVAQEASYFRRTLKNLADAFGAQGPEHTRIRASRSS